MKDGLSGTTDRATGAVLPSIVDRRHSVPMATEANGSYVVNKPSARSWLTTARVRPHPTEGAWRKGLGMNRISKIGLGMAGVLALVLTQAAPAHADGEARSTDVVGIGSDTLQYAM